MGNPSNLKNSRNNKKKIMMLSQLDLIPFDYEYCEQLYYLSIDIKFYHRFKTQGNNRHFSSITPSSISSNFTFQCLAPVEGSYVDRK